MNPELRTRSTVEDGIYLRTECSGTTVVDYQPGNGTRYVVAITDLTDLRSEARDTLGGHGQADSLFQVSRLNGGRGASMMIADRVSWHRVKECGLGGADVDAVVLAELIGYLTGLKVELPRWAAEEG